MEMDFLADTFVYKLMTWKHKPLVQYSTLALLHVFFYLYIVRGLSLVFMLSAGALGLFTWRVFKPSSCNDELISEEAAKKLYLGLYVGLNKFV